MTAHKLTEVTAMANFCSLPPWRKALLCLVMSLSALVGKLYMTLAKFRKWTKATIAVFIKNFACR